MGDLQARLSTALAQLDALGDGFSGPAARLRELRGRLDRGRFHLAVLGQFKRGKSTLLNALLGEAVLPSAVVPLTAIPTFVRPGTTRGARVHFADGRSPSGGSFADAAALAAFLAEFVTETGNPENRRGVVSVEVLHPAPVLARGAVLIDTPGIGSTLRHNTEATLNFLPQCDAALFLVSADPPVTEVEVAFLREVRSKVSRIFFLLNKVDYLGPDERHEAEAFLRRVLTEQVGLPPTTPIFSVSARDGLAGRQTGDAQRWMRSGMERVEEHLLDFLANDKTAAFAEAIGRKADDALDDALMRLRLEARALEMSIAELEQRLASFAVRIAEAERERIAAGDLLAGDQRRLHEQLEVAASELRQEAREYLRGVVHAALAREGRVNEAAVQGAIEEAIPRFFEHRVGRTTSDLQQRMDAALEPHRARAAALVDAVRAAAAELFEISQPAPESTEIFELVADPAWVTHRWPVTLNPIPPTLTDRLVPEAVRNKRIRKRLFDQVEALVRRNVENLRWTAYQSIDVTFRRFGRILDERLAATIAATQGATRATLERRRQAEGVAAEEAARIAAAIAKLEAIRNRGQGPDSAL